MTQEEQILKDFYRHYKNWVLMGANNYEPYTQTNGLCACLCRYLKDKGTHCLIEDSVYSLMQDSFTKAGLANDFPFNRDGLSYMTERNKHLNPQRWKWVLDHATV